MNGCTPLIVASYCDVKDQPTAELMKRFYRALLTSGVPPAAALRTAQRSMRAEGRWRSPVYWAAFAVYGLPCGRRPFQVRPSASVLFGNVGRRSARLLAGGCSDAVLSLS